MWKGEGVGRDKAAAMERERGGGWGWWEIGDVDEANRELQVERQEGGCKDHADTEQERVADSALRHSQRRKRQRAPLKWHGPSEAALHVKPREQ